MKLMYKNSRILAFVTTVETYFMGYITEGNTKKVNNSEQEVIDQYMYDLKETINHKYRLSGENLYEFKPHTSDSRWGVSDITGKESFVNDILVLTYND